MFGFNLFPEVQRSFNQTYRCYSVSMLPGNEREDVEKGGKIIMPPSALDQLTRLNINYPMLFKITNQKSNRQTHCGVLEFVADEGRVYLPNWMMRNLLAEHGGCMMQIESVSIPVASFSKFQPLSTDFLDISNPKAVLENALRNFACLTEGDTIAFKYNDREYEMMVLETKPGKAVSIIECDMDVDFAPPIGYEEKSVVGRKQEEEKQMEEEEVRDEEEEKKFKAFSGSGTRLDGKNKASSPTTEQSNHKPARRGIPDYNYQPGYIKFIRNNSNHQNNHVSPDEDAFKPFGGSGKSLRDTRNK